MLNFLSNHSDVVFMFLLSFGLFVVLMSWFYYCMKATEKLPEKIFSKKKVKAKLVDIIEYTGLYINYETKKEEVMTLYKLIFEYELNGETYRAETPKAWTQEYKDKMVEMQEEGIFTDEIFVTVSLKDYSIVYATPPYLFDKERESHYWRYKHKKIKETLLNSGLDKKQVNLMDYDFYENIESYVTAVYVMAFIFGALCLIWIIGFARMCFILVSLLPLIL